MKPCVFLDRDGVINHDSSFYIKSPREWEPIPGSLEAIAQLNAHGFLVGIITNQSGIGRGLYGFQDLEAIHEKMISALKAVGGEVHGIFVCPHRPEDHCSCRKPHIGLLQKALHFFQLEKPQGIPFVGDRLSDILAAQAMGCEPILVKTGMGEKTLELYPEILKNVRIYNHLAHAVEHFIA